MDLLQKIAENKINEAIEAGEFDNLPGAGQPIDLKEYFSMPPECRAAFQLLRNAHIVPTEVELIRELNRLREKYLFIQDTVQRKSILKQIQLKEAELHIILEKRRK